MFWLNPKELTQSLRLSWVLVAVVSARHTSQRFPQMENRNFYCGDWLKRSVQCTLKEDVDEERQSRHPYLIDLLTVLVAPKASHGALSREGSYRGSAVQY